MTTPSDLHGLLYYLDFPLAHKSRAPLWAKKRGWTHGVTGGVLFLWLYPRQSFPRREELEAPALRGVGLV